MSTSPSGSDSPPGVPAASPAEPPPAVLPPTPPVRLSALLGRADLGLGLRQVGGPPVNEREGERLVQWVHTSEMEDPYPYLLGGELLLSAGLHLPEAAGAGAYLDAYVGRVVAAGGAALGFGVAPVHEAVPRGLVAACDHWGLPLIEVPSATPFSAVARAVWRLMAESRHAGLRRAAEAQRGLATAAAGPDPVRAVLTRLAALLDGYAVLLGPTGEILVPGRRGAPPDPARALLGGLATKLRPGPATRPAPASATETAGRDRIAVYALTGTGGHALGTVCPAGTEGEQALAQIAVVLLSLLTADQPGASWAGRTSALVALLLGDAPATVAGCLSTGPWTVVRARRSPHGGPVDTLAASGLGTALGSTLVGTGPDADTVRVLLPAGAEPTPQRGWTLGAATAPERHRWRPGGADPRRSRRRSRRRRRGIRL
ncbi:PucR family transcriptional regulator ligand-binding domain-containing protein, partial [Streptomyces sp. CHA3]|uniref:PucR family transcriptional regulator ligand-binding domain-containing protein n=1 Tax=Streptomyces sp. CHA3 TaxID=2841669 RepID=UPI002094032F